MSKTVVVALLCLLIINMVHSDRKKRAYVGSGSYLYTDSTGVSQQVTYVEDENGIRITSSNVSPEDEQKIIAAIKSQRNVSFIPAFSWFGFPFFQFPSAPNARWGNFPWASNFNIFGQ